MRLLTGIPDKAAATVIQLPALIAICEAIHSTRSIPTCLHLTPATPHTQHLASHTSPPTPLPCCMQCQGALTKLIIMDSSGSDKARDLARALTSLGQPLSYVMMGGFKGWAAAELPVEEDAVEYDASTGVSCICRVMQDSCRTIICCQC
jgi:hypothetical protein